MKITHLYPLLLGNYKNQVTFLTERNGKIYHLTDDNEFSNEEIKNLINKKEIFELKTPIEIEEDETLLSSMNKVWVGVENHPNPYMLKMIGRFSEIVHEN